MTLPDDPQRTLALRVRQINDEAEDVISIVLSRPDGGELPEWQPGSHVDLVLPSGLIRQYSLCGDLHDRHHYRIAVLREAASRGGSLEIHESGLVGRELSILGPRNRFALVDAEQYLFIAGGIGITPMIPMIQQVEGRGLPWRLVYGGRTRSHMAFLGALQAHGGALDIRPQDQYGLLDLETLVTGAAPGTAIYACGPSAMLAALESCCLQHGRPESLHLERFTLDPVEHNTATERDADELAEIEVELARTEKVVVVPAGKSILDCIEEVVPSILFSCEEGYCGTCETKVLGGIPDHRDTFLTDEERASNATMMICVSRAKTPRIVLDV